MLGGGAAVAAGLRELAAVADRFVTSDHAGFDSPTGTMPCTIHSEGNMSVRLTITIDEDVYRQLKQESRPGG